MFFPITLLILLPFLYLVMRYKFQDKVGVRKKFADIMRQRGQKPMIVAPNHLTKIDSILLQIACVSSTDLFTKYSWVFWHVLDPINLPFLCPVLKVIPISRMGERKQVQQIKEKIKSHLQRGDLVVIFPEGSRSQTGKVDTENFQYGIGEIIQEIPNASVLCAYIRGKRQHHKSSIPSHAETLDVSLKVIEPMATSQGLRGAREISRQVIGTLQQMEEDYFASCRK